MKQFISILGMLVAFIIPAFAVNATPTTHSMYVDGVKQNVGVYTIDGNNYFKLRDIAAAVNGTAKQFQISLEVSGDGDMNAIWLTSNKAYTTVGGELNSVLSGTQDAKASTATVYKDGAVVSYCGYNINNNNFYKLRDVAKSFDIGITWDGAMQRVDIITNESYTEEETTTNAEKSTGNYTTEEDLSNGTLSKEWTEFVESTGEETVSVTLNFAVEYNIENSTRLPHTEFDLFFYNGDIADATYDFDPLRVTRITTGSDGTVSFTIDIPKRVYLDLETYHFLMKVPKSDRYNGTAFPEFYLEVFDVIGYCSGSELGTKVWICYYSSAN